MNDEMGPAERAEKRENAWRAAKLTAPSDKAILERSGWWDVLPESQARMRAAAERYLEHHDFEESARRRVREVWIEHKYRPAWEPRDASQTQRRERMREALPGLGLAEENPLA